MIKTTKKAVEAQLVTHGGSMHADEVMATYILSKVFGEVKVLRTFKVPDNLSEDVIIYDIGFGQYDHHQKGGNGTRENGVPYAACGLIWKEFGPCVVQETCDPEFVWNVIDRDLIQGIDAIDNGKMPKVDYPTSAKTVSGAIKEFNPSWDSEEEPDKAFERAVEFAGIIFENALKSANSKAKAKEIVETAIAESEGHIMILKQYAPWEEFVFSSQNPKAEDIWFVVYPSQRGGYNWQCVPDAPKSFGQRKTVPPEWRGLRDKDLQNVAKIKTATFCHPAGFIGGAETFQDALKMAKKAVNC